MPVLPKLEEGLLSLVAGFIVGLEAFPDEGALGFAGGTDRLL